MSVYFSLGGIEFTGFELPERMPVGGAQALIVHKMIGGRRVVDAMGPDDAPLEWSGIFLDENAELKVFQLDLLRRSGRQVQMTFATRAYQVVVSKFTGTMERPYYWTYSISCEVVEDQVAGDGGKASVDLEQQIAADIVAMEAYAAARDEVLAAASLAATAVKAAMGDPSARRAIGSIVMAEAQGFLGDAVMEATGQATQANMAVAGVAAVGGVVMGGDPAVMAQGFLATSASIHVAHQAGLSGAHAARVQTNLAGAAA